MKERKFLLPSVPAFLCILFLSLAGCTKQVPGPKGDPGTPGQQGNATMTSIPVTIEASSWSFNNVYYSRVLFIPEITREVVNSGDVKVYMKVNSQWWCLPYGVGDIFMQSTFQENNLVLRYTKIHDGPPPSPGKVDIRIVIFSNVLK